MRILRPYGSTEPIEITLFDLTGADLSSETLASGDVMISKDGGSFTDVSTLPTNTGGQVRWTPEAGELDAKAITLRVRDQTSPATFVVVSVTIETYDHPDSMHPNLGLDAQLAALGTFARGGTNGNGTLTIGGRSYTLTPNANAQPIVGLTEA